MTRLFALLAAALLASCGGGGSSAPDASSSPLIRYQGRWGAASGTIPARLTIEALPGEASISSNPVARVEVQLGQSAPAIMTAANSTDSSGRPRYVFDFAHPEEAPFCASPFATLQIRITVVDVTGFAYTKNIVDCATTNTRTNPNVFGAFSDYGTTQARFSYTATAPVTAIGMRTSSTGYVDALASMVQASFSGTLPSVEGDALVYKAPPSAARIAARIDGGGGSFAESIGVGTSPDLFIACCGPRPVSPDKVIAHVRMDNGADPAQTYSYRLQITDPATGAVIGTQAGTTYSIAYIPITVQRGHLIEFEVAPNTPGRVVQGYVAVGSQSSGGIRFAYATSNEMGTPARFKVYCCSP